MARTLAANLTTALARDNHQPALSLTSESFADTIPMDGNAFAFNNDYTFKPNVIYHSTGRLCAIMREPTGSVVTEDTVIYIYTDTARTVFTKVEIPGIMSGAEGNISKLAIVELSNGNIGVVMARHGSSDTTEGIYFATITVTGTVVEADSLITTHPRASNGSYGNTGLTVALFSDGTYYCVYCYTTSTGWAIYKLTSSDWVSWTGPTQISPSGLTTGSYEEVEGVYVFEDTVENNDCFLLFAYTDTVENEDNKIFNIYSMLSSDYGSTWGAPSARTAYTTLGSSGKTPVLVQKSNGTLSMVFYEQNGVLRMDENTDNWQDSEFGACPNGFNVRTLYYNATTGHITCSYGRGSTTPGGKVLCGVLVIDMDSWEIIDNFNEYSTPALNQVWADETSFENYEEFAQGSKFVCSMTQGILGEVLVMVLDVEARTFTYYATTSEGDDRWAAYGLYSNINASSSEWWPGRTAESCPWYQGCCLNEPGADKLYLLWSDDYPAAGRGYYIGCIDLTAPPDESGFYTIDWVGAEHGHDWERWDIYGLKYINAYDSEGYVVVSGGNMSYNGGVVVHDMTSGAAVYECYGYAMDPSFPYHGAYSRPKFYNGHVYFDICYANIAGYTNQIGMCDINISTGSILYHRPTWAVTTNYNLYGYYAVDTVNNCLWLAPLSDAGDEEWVVAAKLDLNSGAWTAYTHLTFPGIPSEAYTCSRGQNIFYDETTGNIGVALGVQYGYSSEQGIIMFNTANDFNQVKYLQSEYVDEAWDWGEHGDIASLVQSTASSNAGAAVDGEDVMWVLWDSLNPATSVYTPYWDRDMGAYELYDYLVGQLQIKWEIKKPNSLSFTLSRGHLFDPQNSLSALRDIVQKGRLVVVQMGEYYNGTAYLENQGKYVVREVSLQYGRGQYPKIAIRCESLSCIWKEQEVTATSLYSGTPDLAIKDVLTNYAQLTESDYSIPEFEDEHNLTHQFIDQNIWEIIEELCDHWFYIPYDDHDGVFTCVKVDLDREVDHTYSDGMKIAEFTPDDSQSDFTNAIRVIGESSDMVDVIYDEELITTIAGTVGWWENDITKTIRYSGDENTVRKCRNPRLRVIQSIQLQGLLMNQLAAGDGGEFISDIDEEETYCVITIAVPDLTYAVVVAVSGVVLSGAMAIGCDGFMTGWCGASILALAVASSVAFYLLAAVANYQYELHARPLGEEKMSIQYIAEDTEHQQNLGGRRVQQNIDDCLCYTVVDCRRVAEATLEMVQAQRQRVRFKKVAHMADELLDKIKITHPYSEENMELVVVGLTRTYKKGSSDSDGVWDEVEGWRTA